MLSRKANKLRAKLVEFRRKHSQIEPIEQGNLIKNQEKCKKY